MKFFAILAVFGFAFAVVQGAVFPITPTTSATPVTPTKSPAPAPSIIAAVSELPKVQGAKSIFNFFVFN